LGIAQMLHRGTSCSRGRRKPVAGGIPLFSPGSARWRARHGIPGCASLLARRVVRRVDPNRRSRQRKPCCANLRTIPVPKVYCTVPASRRAWIRLGTRLTRSETIGRTIIQTESQPSNRLLKNSDGRRPGNGSPTAGGLGFAMNPARLWRFGGRMARGKGAEVGSGSGNSHSLT